MLIDLSQNHSRGVHNPFMWWFWQKNTCWPQQILSENPTTQEFLFKAKKPTTEKKSEIYFDWKNIPPKNKIPKFFVDRKTYHPKKQIRNCFWPKFFVYVRKTYHPKKHSTFVFDWKKLPPGKFCWPTFFLNKETFHPKKHLTIFFLTTQI